MGLLPILQGVGALVGGISGLRGGGQRETTRMPKWLEEAMQQNLDRAGYAASLGFTPNYGVDVAAFTPMQQAAMQGTNAAAGAFGMPTVGTPGMGMPQTRDAGNGIQGYSSGDVYQQALQELRNINPAQYAALQAPFYNPVTGAAPTAPGSSQAAQDFNPLANGGAGGPRNPPPAQPVAPAQPQHPSANGVRHPADMGMAPGTTEYAVQQHRWWVANHGSDR